MPGCSRLEGESHMSGRMSLRPPDEVFFIWSYEHQAWWRPGSRGYTEDWKQAGRYPREHAQSIVDDSLGMEIMLPVEVVVQLLDAYLKYLTIEMNAAR
jgi:hypothetical protein